MDGNSRLLRLRVPIGGGRPLGCPLLAVQRRWPRILLVRARLWAGQTLLRPCATGLRTMPWGGPSAPERPNIPPRVRHLCRDASGTECWGSREQRQAGPTGGLSIRCGYHPVRYRKTPQPEVVTTHPGQWKAPNAGRRPAEETRKNAGESHPMHLNEVRSWRSRFGSCRSNSEASHSLPSKSLIAHLIMVP